MKIEITRHAEQRMREWCGLNKKSGKNQRKSKFQ